MQKFLTNAQMREADRYTIEVLGVPSSQLMLRAGSAIAKAAAGAADEYGRRVLVVCGEGNNGGDGYVCASQLLRLGYDVKVLDVSGGSYSPECAARRKEYAGPYAEDVRADVAVDCIFGTGLSRPVEGRCADVVEAINKSGAFVVSADIPSGICGDSGRVLGCAVRADVTVAIAEYKLGHVLGDGPDYCGAVTRADIGIAARGDCALACEDADVAPFFPARLRNTHKGTYGSACLVAGSPNYPGAAALCLSAALRSGCGYVKLCADDNVKNALVAAYPQTIYLSEPDLGCQALAVGPGCGNSEATFETVKRVLANYRGKLILDADALNAVSGRGAEVLSEKSCDVLITPHPAEFSRLTGRPVGDIVSDPTGSARAFAAEYGVTVLLKGAATVITDGSKVMLNLRGSTALARGGSGDMLTGLICGCAARGLGLFDAAVAAAYALGVSAEIASAEKTDYCATAQDILGSLPAAVKKITGA